MALFFHAISFGARQAARLLACCSERSWGRAACLGVTIFAAACTALAGVHGVVLDASPDRAKTPLRLELERIGTLRPRGVDEINSSNWTLGCETLDRDFANFEEYKEFIPPLGIKTIRLQAGWAKCEREKGVYDFDWLEKIIDFAVDHGINVLLETDYGNPIYEGGGGWDLAGGFPSSDEALAAWDAWVDAISLRFGGRVRDWAMWNEPDIGVMRKFPAKIAEFNVRTAKIIRKNNPDARIAGLSLAAPSPDFMEKCLAAMGDDVKLFDWIIYHGYAAAPESTYGNVEKLKKVLAKYNSRARMRQGENGCPSEMTTRFAMPKIPWTEYSQAKWDMRRMLGDLGHDVESCVFTICDFNHIGREINRKGLLRADGEHNVTAVKLAYYAVQNTAGVFDDRWTRVADGAFSSADKSLSTWEYRDKAGRPLYVFWSFSDDPTNAAPVRPMDEFKTRPCTFKAAKNAKLRDPVFVDLLSGGVYEFPKSSIVPVKGGVELRGVPVYDSPCLITDKSALELQ